MRLLRLDILRPGDVVFETGEATIASATGGPFGHASLALGRLVKIEAGKKDGVVLSPFDISAFRRDEERIVGVRLRDGDDVLVKRNEILPNDGSLDGRALLEAGRTYSLAKALELPDLAPARRARLERKLAARNVTADAEGRICSETVARILDLPSTLVSPNALAAADGLEEVDGAVVELGDDWCPEPIETARSAVSAAVASIEPGVAARAMAHAEAAAASIRQGDTTAGTAAADLEAELEVELQIALRALRDIRTLEATILHTGAEPV